MTKTVSLLLLGHLIYALSFKYLPSAVTTAVSGSLVIAYATVALACWLKRQHSDLTLAFVPLGFLCVCWIIGSQLWELAPSGSTPSLASGLRQISPFVMFVALLSARNYISSQTVLAMIVIVAAAAWLHVAIFPKEILNHTPRYPAFSSGLHTSGYILAACIIGTFYLWRNGQLSKPQAFILFGCFCALVIGNGVRTPVVLLVTFATLVLITQQFFAAQLRWIVAVFLGGFILVGLLTVLTLDGGALSNISSGRLANYMERLELINQRPLLQILFGSGPGSDLLQTSVWWWDQKDSHSDLLKYFWEAGLLGFSALMLVFAVLVGHDKRLLPVIGAILAASAISNAVLVRPNAAFIFFAMIAYGLSSNQTKAKPATSEASVKN